AIGALHPNIISFFPSFNYWNTASIKSLTGSAASCRPYPPRSVFSAGEITSMTSIFLDFNKRRAKSVKE
ncbi:MAG: hypothetical protein WKF89_19240, partial [Chitinophagaceae bacterium]